MSRRTGNSWPWPWIRTMDGGPVNAMQKVYVEIDGKPHTAWERKFTYRSD